jgi:hypothetical protein
MNEVCVFPEMLEAGIETLIECRRRGMPDDETAVAVYLAMEAVSRMRMMRDATGTVH